MIELTMRDFHAQNYVDEGFELYIAKRDTGEILYVGVTGQDVWSRWFDWNGHMSWDGTHIRGRSAVGQEIEVHLPESLDWRIQLWTLLDCVQFLQAELPATRREPDIKFLEPYMIQKLAPTLNVVYQSQLWEIDHANKPQSVTIPLRDATISDAMRGYLAMVKLARSGPTMLAYKTGLQVFGAVLAEEGLEPGTASITELTDDLVSPLVAHLKAYAPATEQLYLQAIKGFYEYVDAERLADVNLSRVRVLIRRRARRPGISFPQRVPSNEIERLLSQVEQPGGMPLSPEDEDSEVARLRAARDRAFLLTLADTGLRVHEACGLRRGDINWNERYAIVIGKGDKQAVVRFTSRAIDAIRGYLSSRAALDGNSGKQLSSLPVFARHDKGAGKKIKPITPTTGRNIVNERVSQGLGDEMVGKITPHSFRHYFVTSVLRGTGNLRLAQELARHSNIQVTQRYTHLSNDELDKAYYDVFERRSNKPGP